MVIPEALSLGIPVVVGDWYFTLPELVRKCPLVIFGDFGNEESLSELEFKIQKSNVKLARMHP